MQRRRGLVWGLCCLLCLASVGCGRSVSVGRARSIAERYAGHDLSQAEVTVSRSGQSRIALFAVGSIESRARREYRVNLANGQFVGWLFTLDRQPGEGSDAFSDEDAIDYAREAAHAVLGAEADSLQWTVATGGSRVSTVMGSSPLRGDPPRSGLGPQVVAVVRSDGVVTSYRQYAPAPRDREPLPVRVSREAAVEIANREFWVPDARTAPVRADLYQRDGEVFWTTQTVLLPLDEGSDAYGGLPEAYLTCLIDAQSGRVLARDARLGFSYDSVSRGFLGKRRHNAAVRFWNTHWPWRPIEVGAGAVGLLTVAGLGVRRWLHQRASAPPPEEPETEGEEPAQPSSWFEA